MRLTKELPDPTPAELDVLKVLWKAGRLSTREVHEQLRATHAWAFSTTRTTMDRMVKKGLLVRASFHGVTLYEPTATKPTALAAMIRDFADRVLELDASALVPLFVKSRGLTPAEVEDLSRLLAAARTRRKR